MADAQPQRSSLLPAQVVPDSVLVRQARAGDQQAFELLVSRYHGPLTSYIRSLLNDGDQVADVLQEVYLRLYLSLPTLLTNSSLRGWLFQVARNRCIDELRKRRRYTEIPFSTLLWDAGEQDLSLPETIPDPAPLPEEVVEQFDLPCSLHQALGSLSPKFRLIVQLHCLRQLTFAEIGCLLNMREITARTNFFRALVRLRKALAGNTHLAAVS
jgi:RNA polymerase sigma factor (sigma-70 family)